MGLDRWMLVLLLLWPGMIAGCAPHSPPDAAKQAAEVEQPPPPATPPAPVMPPLPEPPPPAPPPAEEPPPPGDEPPPISSEAVTPRVRLGVQPGEDEGCVGTVEIAHVPAYDPITEHVLALETYARKMSDQREAELVWYDAKTGAEIRREDLYADVPERGCARGNRKARRRGRALNEELGEGAWESMTPVRIRRVHDDAYDNLIDQLNDKAADEELEETLAQWAETLMPRGQVHVVVRRSGTVVRLPGIKVYERDVDISPNILAELVGHRPSGIVAATHADCRDDDDCTCNLEESTTVMRWSPATLAAIDASPCVLTEGDADDAFPCSLGSIYDG